MYLIRPKSLPSAIILLALLCASAGAVYRSSGPTGPVPGKFIVKFKLNVRPQMLSQSLGKEDHLYRFSNVIVRGNLEGSGNWDRVYVLICSGRSLGADGVEAMLGEENIEYVEPDYYLEFFDYPDDSLFSNQWYLRNEGQEYLGIERFEGNGNDRLVLKSGTPGEDIHLAALYGDPPVQTARVVVAIVDTGIDLVHPELAGRLWKNRDEIPGNGVDDDHNGFVDDTIGYDISGDLMTLFDPVGDNDPTDSLGHGTHIAGIVGANADGRGVVGISPEVEIMPVKIRPNATNAVGAAGIVYAVNAGAQAINISWGTPFESGLLREAIAFARQNGVFVAIAPGNSGGSDRFFPAAYDSTFVVAAGNSDGYMTDFSTYGAHIDIVAPGLDILSLRAAGTDMYSSLGEPHVRIIGDEGLYYLADGTSMATPTVVGAAALLLAIRPDLSLSALEEILLLGADDLIDPLNTGDTLYGRDTISGFGYVNVDASLSLLKHGGLFFTQPERRRRYTEDFPVKVASVADYEGSWRLDYSVGPGCEDWMFLAGGDSIPGDAVLYMFNDTTIEGHLNFRLTNQYGSRSFTNCIHVRQRRLAITSPAPGTELKYNIPVHGNAYGPGYDSMSLFYRRSDDLQVALSNSTGEFFDSLLSVWTVSGVDTGSFTLHLKGYYASCVLEDSVMIRIVTAFAYGWPQKMAGRAGITAACADLNRDGRNEIVVTTSSGLYLFEASGEMIPGYPVLVDQDLRCVPAIYDVDRDGQDEVICTGPDGIHAFKYDGSYADGWPQQCFTGQIGGGYGYPNPTVTALGPGEDSAVVIINKLGQILAYEFNGDSYFFSLGGLFASFDPRVSDSYGYGGSTSPFVTAVDLTGNGINEVVASYTSPAPYSGIGVFEGRTGRPAFGLSDPVVQPILFVDGTVLADLDGDHLPEIITLGRDTLSIPRIWVRTAGLEEVPGWPVALPAVAHWIGSYPVAADLDLDGVPEIMCTFFEYDMASLYIFTAEGAPYLLREGRPAGEVYTQPVTFGTPTVANLTGDEYPEIIIRSGHVLPGTGNEMVYILDHRAQPIPEWPVITPTRPSRTFSSRYAPLVDDIDGDNKVELIMASDGLEVLVWDFDASYDEGRNKARFLMDNLNSGVWPLGVGEPTDVEGEPETVPLTASLAQNYPNPFNPTTIIRFNLPRGADVKLDVFNILGQKVATLIDRRLPAGPHEAVFDGTGHATGVYFYRLKTDDLRLTMKMVLLK